MGTYFNFALNYYISAEGIVITYLTATLNHTAVGKCIPFSYLRTMSNMTMMVDLSSFPDDSTPVDCTINRDESPDLYVLFDYDISGMNDFNQSSINISGKTKAIVS
jgi:hypothetical protein